MSFQNNLFLQAVDECEEDRIWHPITQFGGSGPHAMNCIPMMLEIE